MIRKKELKQGLFAKIGTLLSVHGFQERRTIQSFVKPIEGGHQSFHLALVDHAHDFHVIADVGIRFDELEELVNADSRVLSKREKAITYSMGVEIGNLSEGQQRRWEVRSESDIDPVAQDIVQAYKLIAVPYLEKYSCLNRAFEMLSRDDREVWINSPVHVARAKRAVGLASILGKYDEMKALVERKKRYLEKMEDPRLDDFLRFARKICADINLP